MTTNKKVFDEIAESWYHFRHWSRFTKELEETASRWQKGKLLNIGCAHGPDFLPFKGSFELWGVDFSKEMVRLAHKYANKFNLKVNLAVADAISLPYHENNFDWAIAIATYHHIKGNEQRQQALHELKRVLKPGGEAFITVWNKWQPGFWLKGKDTNIPWKMRGKILHRYYYLFSYPELHSLLTSVGFEIMSMFPEKTYRFPLKFFSHNICVMIKKQ